MPKRLGQVDGELYLGGGKFAAAELDVLGLDFDRRGGELLDHIAIVILDEFQAALLLVLNAGGFQLNGNLFAGQAIAEDGHDHLEAFVVGPDGGGSTERIEADARRLVKFTDADSEHVNRLARVARPVDELAIRFLAALVVLAVGKDDDGLNVVVALALGQPQHGTAEVGGGAHAVKEEETVADILFLLGFLQVRFGLNGFGIEREPAFPVGLGPEVLALEKHAFFVGHAAKAIGGELRLEAPSSSWKLRFLPSLRGKSWVKILMTLSWRVGRSSSRWPGRGKSSRLFMLSETSNNSSTRAWVSKMLMYCRPGSRNTNARMA